MKVVYQVFGTENKGGFGILGKDENGRCGAATPFTADRSLADRLVKRLNDMQTPISDFRDYYIKGELEKLCAEGSGEK